jgi:hypothetical protein
MYYMTQTELIPKRLDGKITGGNSGIGLHSGSSKKVPTFLSPVAARMS